MRPKRSIVRLVSGGDTNGCSGYTKVCGRCQLRRTSRLVHPTDCELICFARKRNLDGQLRQINTTGKSVKTCPAIRAKIFRLTCRANQPHNSARLTADEGRWPSSRTRGEMRWTREAHMTCAPDAYGEVVWS